MKSRLVYVELKSGYSDNGPAWIGKALFSKSGQTIYFNGQAFRKGRGSGSTHWERESGEDYWISGVKKNGEDRHWAGRGKIQIDASVIGQYLTLLELTELPKSKYEVVQLDNTPPKQELYQIENKKSEGV